MGYRDKVLQAIQAEMHSYTQTDAASVAARDAVGYVLDRVARIPYVSIVGFSELLTTTEASLDAQFQSWAAAERRVRAEGEWDGAHQWRGDADALLRAQVWMDAMRFAFTLFNPLWRAYTCALEVGDFNAQ